MNPFKRWRAFLADDSGQGMVEYILIIGLIVLFIVVTLIAFRKEVSAFIERVTKWISGANPPSEGGGG
jgi:Flp pilus assembly pilin Flp